MYLSLGFPLSPTSEYSSDSNYSISVQSLMPGHTPSPPPTSPYYSDCPPLATAGVAYPASAASHSGFSPANDYLTHHRATTHYPPTRISAPNPAYTTYTGYPSHSNHQLYAPSSSATHGSLPLLSQHTLPNRTQSYSAPSVAPALTTSQYHYTQDDQVQQASPLLERTSNEYSSGSGMGAGTGGVTLGGLRQESYEDESTHHSFALPSVTDILSSSNAGGPTRNTRSHRQSAPYPSYGGSTRRGSSPARYVPTSDPLQAATSLDPLLTSPRRSSRPASRKGNASAGVGAVLEKNYVCKMCDARFARNHDLTRHHKVHDPVKAYKCKGCERRFTRKDALKRHATQKNCGVDSVDDEAPVASPSRGRRASRAEPEYAASSHTAYQPPAVPLGMEGHGDSHLDDARSSGQSYGASPTMGSAMASMSSHQQPSMSPHRRSLRQPKLERYEYYPEYQ